MPMKTHAHGYVDISINRATADGPAGLGAISSTTATRRTGDREVMRDADDTEFHDTIAIVGDPEWYLPIGFATFLCEVWGSFSQPATNVNLTGSGNATAMFGAQAAGAPAVDQDAWTFPSMAGPQAWPVIRILTATVMFVIGEPIQMFSTLNTRSRESARRPKSGDLDATLTLDTVLYPILVEGVSDPVAITLTDSQTKYYAAGEANAQDVSLRSARLVFAHA
jgi:hypothetical protein